MIPLEEIRAAQERVEGSAIRTPLVRLNTGDSSAAIYLKLENLQPIGSFKLRGATNAIKAVPPGELKNGVYTSSAGNMAQGIAWCAKRMGIPCSVIVPDRASKAKIEAITRLGATIIKVPFAEWWDVMTTHNFDGMDGLFIHPVANANVIAGNGTIGLEVVDDLPDFDAIVIPYGGGGLSCGIASALKGLNSNAKVFACEVDGAAPLAASLDAGKAVEIEMTPSFVDGIGSPTVLPEMWPLAQELLDGSLVVSAEDVASAIRLLAERNNVIAEGAGAASVAAALNGIANARRIVCVISGGNIDLAKLTQIFRGETP